MLLTKKIKLSTSVGKVAYILLAVTVFQTLKLSVFSLLLRKYDIYIVGSFPILCAIALNVMPLFRHS